MAFSQVTSTGTDVSVHSDAEIRFLGAAFADLSGSWGIDIVANGAGVVFEETAFSNLGSTDQAFEGFIRLTIGGDLSIGDDFMYNIADQEDSRFTGNVTVCQPRHTRSMVTRGGLWAAV